MKRLLLPMLATAAAPFDGEDYLFEVKWDGVRALAASEAAGRWRLWGRTGADYTTRYAELAVLARLPAGTVVDGELVVLRDGRADFSALLRRHQRQRPELLRAAGCPGQPAVCYVLFAVPSHPLPQPQQRPRNPRRRNAAPLIPVGRFCSCFSSCEV